MGSLLLALWGDFSPPWTYCAKNSRIIDKTCLRKASGSSRKNLGTNGRLQLMFEGGLLSKSRKAPKILVFSDIFHNAPLLGPKMHKYDLGRSLCLFEGSWVPRTPLEGGLLGQKHLKIKSTIKENHRFFQNIFYNAHM